MFEARSLGAVLVVTMGGVIAWFDTRPGWDDTGVTAGALLLLAGAAALSGVRWWLAAGLAVLPLLMAEVGSAGWGLVAAPLFSAAGALGGALVRRAE